MTSEPPVSVAGSEQRRFNVVKHRISTCEEVVDGVGRDIMEHQRGREQSKPASDITDAQVLLRSGGGVNKPQL